LNQLLTNCNQCSKLLKVRHKSFHFYRAPHRDRPKSHGQWRCRCASALGRPCPSRASVAVHSVRITACTHTSSSSLGLVRPAVSRSPIPRPPPGLTEPTPTSRPSDLRLRLHRGTEIQRIRKRNRIKTHCSHHTSALRHSGPVIRGSLLTPPSSFLQQLAVGWAFFP
jgi:hypothetical protein